MKIKKFSLLEFWLDRFYFFTADEMTKNYWKTELYKYFELDNPVSHTRIIFLLFENMENYKKWQKVKNKKFIVKKVYKLTNNIQVVGEVAWPYNKELFLKRINYYIVDDGEAKKIGIGKASQLNLTF